jgi:arabinofuranosyltransferase
VVICVHLWFPVLLMRKPGWVTALIAVECALVAGVLWTQFPTWWGDRWVQDDAYVSFRYARNLVRGHGLVYNVGEPVEGYTNFLWTALAAVPLARGAADPLPFMYAVSAACWIGSYALLLALGVGLGLGGVWAAPLAVLPLAVHWSYNMWFFSGMETPLVALLTIAAVVCVSLDPTRHRWSLFSASLCGVGLLMTRPDGVFVVAALALSVALLDGHWIARERRWLRALLLPALPVLLIFLPYEAWRLWYYGSLLPNTYYAKVAYLTYYARGWRYVRGYAIIYGLRPFLALGVAGAAMARRGPAQRFLTAAVLATAAVVFYVVRLGGDFMEWRFLTPISAVYYPAMVVGAAVLGERLVALTRARDAWLPRCGWLAGSATAVALALVTQHAAADAQRRGVPDQETIALLRRYNDPGRFDWRTAGRLFDSVLPTDARIATTSAGVIPYFCDRPCLDLHGLTDPIIAHTPIDPQDRGRTGHEHWLQDYAEMRRRGVDIVLEWVDPNVYPHAVVTAPQDGHEIGSILSPDGRFIDFTLLNPALKPALQADPRVVFHDPTLIANARRLHVLAEQFGDYAVVDSLDWGDEASEAAHAFSEWQGPGSPYENSWHTKLLTHLPPHDGLRLEDNGRRIWGGAAWEVHDVSAGDDLVVVGRIDHTGAAVFDVDVNGQRAPDPLITPGRPDEVWGETAVVIPKALLRDGTNALRITRRPDSERDAEWYYMWFLQPFSGPP